MGEVVVELGPVGVRSLGSGGRLDSTTLVLHCLFGVLCLVLVLGRYSECRRT